MKYMIPLQIVLLVLWFTAFQTASAWLIFLPSIIGLIYLGVVLAVVIAITIQHKL